MKRIVFGAMLLTALFSEYGDAQTFGFGFEFYNNPNMLSWLFEDEYGLESRTGIYSRAAPVIFCDINLGNALKIEPQLGVLVGNGSGDNGMVLNGGLGVFGLHDPDNQILIYYGGRGGIRPWVTGVSTEPQTYWFLTGNVGGELIVAYHFSIGLEGGIGYNFMEEDLHFLSTETRILLRFYLM